MSATPIGDHALLSDRHSAALVTTAGSVDWLCSPRFDARRCSVGCSTTTPATDPSRPTPQGRPSSSAITTAANPCTQCWSAPPGTTRATPATPIRLPGTGARLAHAQ